MITHIPTDDGYDFQLNGKFLASGFFTNDGLKVIEEDCENTFCNGMMALSYLRQKYTPEYYTVDNSLPVFKQHAVKNTDVFKKHPALNGVYPLATRI